MRLHGLILCLTSAIAMACDATDPFAVRPGPDHTSPSVLAGGTTTTFTGGAKGKKRTLAGRLAFTGSDGHIITMWPDGSDLLELPAGSDPSWSPDGQRLAFYRTDFSVYGGQGGIYVMNADGSGVRQVVADGFQPTWSPDGTQLAYSCGGICVINVDGTGRRQLTADGVVAVPPNNCIRDTDPAWSPNGRTIAFTRWPDFSIPTSRCVPFGVALGFPFDFWTQVWLVESDGTGLHPLTANGEVPSYTHWASWSPDGTKLAVFRPHDAVEAISIVNVDGSGLRDVVQRTPSAWDAALATSDWSPDGTRIVVGSGPNWGLADPFKTVNWAELRPAFHLPSNWTVWSWSRR